MNCVSRPLAFLLMLPAFLLALESSLDASGFQLESTAFRDGGDIPSLHTCDGADRSPRLEWTGSPPRANAFALLVDDPDAPGGRFTHWMVYNLPASVRSLEAAVILRPSSPEDPREGRNDFGAVGYRGPCPPPGRPHRYVFRLYALSRLLELSPGANRDAFETALAGNVLAKAEWTGRYERSGKSKGSAKGAF